jgi:Glycosyl hydrolase catalytic core
MGPLTLASRRALGVVALAAGCAAFAPAAHAAFKVAGLSDQHPTSIVDPRIGGHLRMTAVRLVVRWDAALADPAPVQAWLAAARSRGLEPLVVFNRRATDRCPGQPCVLPTVAQYTAAFRAFRQRWPWVTVFAPWNEVNVRSQPPWNSPAQAAAFYNTIVAECAACTVLGAEVLDSTDAPSYLQAMLPFMARPPPAWGVHNYEDINHFRTTATDAILAVVQGPIWLTEAAGLVRYVDGSGHTTYPYDEDRAARATSFMFDYVDAHVDRIERLYYYVWRSLGASDIFDTALLRSDGSTRPAYDVVADRVNRLLGPAVAARRTPFPFQLRSRRARVARGKVVFGPFRCVLPRQGRCVGSLVLRRAGRRHALGVRRFNLRGQRSHRYGVRVALRAAAALRRPHGRWKRGVRLVVRLRQPLAMSRSYPKLRYVRRR